MMRDKSYSTITVSIDGKKTRNKNKSYASKIKYIFAAATLITITFLCITYALNTKSHEHGNIDNRRLASVHGDIPDCDLDNSGISASNTFDILADNLKIGSVMVSIENSDELMVDINLCSDTNIYFFDSFQLWLGLDLNNYPQNIDSFPYKEDFNEEICHYSFSVNLNDFGVFSDLNSNLCFYCNNDIPDFLMALNLHVIVNDDSSSSSSSSSDSSSSSSSDSSSSDISSSGSSSSGSSSSSSSSSSDSSGRRLQSSSSDSGSSDDDNSGDDYLTISHINTNFDCATFNPSKSPTKSPSELTMNPSVSPSHSPSQLSMNPTPSPTLQFSRDIQVTFDVSSASVIIDNKEALEDLFEEAFKNVTGLDNTVTFTSIDGQAFNNMRIRRLLDFIVIGNVLFLCVDNMCNDPLTIAAILASASYISGNMPGVVGEVASVTIVVTQAPTSSPSSSPTNSPTDSPTDSGGPSIVPNLCDPDDPMSCPNPNEECMACGSGNSWEVHTCQVTLSPTMVTSSPTPSPVPTSGGGGFRRLQAFGDSCVQTNAPTQTPSISTLSPTSTGGGFRRRRLQDPICDDVGMDESYCDDKCGCLPLCDLSGGVAAANARCSALTGGLYPVCTKPGPVFSGSPKGRCAKCAPNSYTCDVPSDCCIFAINNFASCGLFPNAQCAPF